MPRRHSPTYTSQTITVGTNCKVYVDRSKNTTAVDQVNVRIDSDTHNMLYLHFPDASVLKTLVDALLASEVEQFIEQ